MPLVNKHSRMPTQSALYQQSLKQKPIDLLHNSLWLLIIEIEKISWQERERWIHRDRGSEQTEKARELGLRKRVEESGSDARERAREEKHWEEEKGAEGEDERKSIRVRWQQRRERGHKSPRPIVCVPIMCVCVCVKSQVSARRLITIHTLANGDKVSNLVHNTSLALFTANGDLLRSYARCFSKHWKCPSQ